ncbi:MAG: phage holin family protein [Pseudomonadota bacterium]
MSGPEGAGLLDAVRALGGTLFALIRTRVELIATELEEEKERRKEMLVLAGIAALFIGMSLLLAAFFFVVLFWDTHRLLAAGAVTLIYAAIGVGALLRWRQKIRNSPPAFAMTSSEFESDWKALRGGNER